MLHPGLAYCDNPVCAKNILVLLDITGLRKFYNTMVCSFAPNYLLINRSTITIIKINILHYSVSLSPVLVPTTDRSAFHILRQPDLQTSTYLRIKVADSTK